MSACDRQASSDYDVDMRKLSEQQGQRMVIAAYEQLTVDEALILLNDQDPQSLHEALDREFAGAFTWEQLPAVDGAFRARITKRASTALPRIVADTNTLSQTVGSAGSIWQLEPGARDLDANIIALQPHDEISMHIGAELDVLILVLEGSGELHTELPVIQLKQGSLVWLPRKSQRRFVAHSQGLRYFSVHQRKPALNISTAPHRTT